MAVRPVVRGSCPIDTRKLWKAKFPNVVRLARFLRLPTPPANCACRPCHDRLVQLVGAHVNR